jgi:hypothetical protein
VQGEDRPGFEANPGPNYLVAGAVPAATGASGGDGAGAMIEKTMAGSGRRME